MRSGKRKQNVKYIFLILLCVLVCLPVLMVVIGSIKDNDELKTILNPILWGGDSFTSFSLLVNYPTIKHFKKLLLLTPEFYTLFWNSIKLVLGTLLFQLCVAVPGAWAFARFRFRGRRLLFNLYVILMLMPFQVTMLSQYLVLDRLNIMNTSMAIILPAAFSTFPVFLIYRGFTNIPKGLFEAAQVDGASEWNLFWNLAVPLGKPGIMSAMILGFLDYWNMIEQPLAFLKEKTLWPLSLYLPEVELTEAGLAFAASVITLLPAVFVFVLGQDYLQKGIIASAMKE